MLKRLLKESEFTKNIFTLIIGTIVAQAFPIIITPIISRLFTTVQFATWGLYVSIVSVLLSTSAGCYDMAIMQPKKDIEAINLFSLSFILSILINFIIFILILIFHSSIASLLNDKHIEFWLIFIPFNVIVLTLLTIITNWYNRKKIYKIISVNKITKNWSASIFQIGLGSFKFQKIGLVLSQLLGDITATITVGYVFLKQYKKLLIKSFSIVSLIALAKKYREFPYFTLPTVFLNNISSYMLILLISIFFSSNITGSYFFAFRLLSAPMAFIGTAVAQTFYQKFTELIRENRSQAKTFIFKIWGVLFGIALIPLMTLFFFGENIFIFIFGQQWALAGKIAAISAPMILISFASSPTSSSFIVLNIQKYSLFFGIAAFIYRPLAFLIGYWLNDFFLGLEIYVICEIIQIFIYNLIVYYQLR